MNLNLHGDPITLSIYERHWVKKPVLQVVSFVHDSLPVHSLLLFLLADSSGRVFFA